MKVVRELGNQVRTVLEPQQATPGEEPELLRIAMRNFASGVSVVTAIDSSGQPVGTTVSAVTSISLDPALLLVSLGIDSSTLTAIVRNYNFVVNILSESQDKLAVQFANGSPITRWEGVDYRSGVMGAPVIEDSLASIECIRRRIVWAGDHRIILGEPLALHSSPELHSPLVLFRSSLSTVNPSTAEQTA